MNPSSQINVLLIEDRPEYAKLLRDILTEESHLLFHIECAAKLETGLKRLSRGRTDLVLLDLSLPDSDGIETFTRVQNQAPSLPIVVFTGLNDDGLALEALRKGAQDYVVKGDLDGKILSRTIRYAMERHRMQQVIRNLSLIDDLTGLYNRRGFWTIAEQHWHLARRNHRDLAVIMADMDSLKGINDKFGHLAGDQAIKDIADILKSTFRKSDIIARIGGDEFAVMAVEAARGNVRILTRRLEENLAKWNQPANRIYRLSLSYGSANFDAENGVPVEEIMARADEALYAHKRSKHHQSDVA